MDYNKEKISKIVWIVTALFSYIGLAIVAFAHFSGIKSVSTFQIVGFILVFGLFLPLFKRELSYWREN